MLIMLGLLVAAMHIYIFDNGSEQPANNNASTGPADFDDESVEKTVDESDTGYVPGIVSGDEVFQNINEEGYQKGLFSWENNAYDSENRSDMYLAIHSLEINEVYQDFNGAEPNDEDALDLARELKIMDVDLYLLTGHSEWAYEADGAPMLDEIERAAAFRDAWGENTLKGIVFDIEPYGSQRWKQGEKTVLMENYVSGMKVAYQAAKSEGFRVILCIPTWYDKHYNEYFVRLSDCCDEISVMNYVREDEYVNMVDEVEYARKMDMGVTCILEFQEVGKHELAEEHTYYIDGIDAAVTSFNNLYREFNYPRLKLAFHYLKPLKQLLLDW